MPLKKLNRQPPLPGFLENPSKSKPPKIQIKRFKTKSKKTPLLDLIKENERRDIHGYLRPSIDKRRFVKRGRVTHFEKMTIQDLSRIQGFNYMRELQKITNAGEGRVVHWGCRQGVAIKQFARLFPNIDFLGVSDIVYESLKRKNRKEKNLKIVIDDKERGLKKIPKNLDLVITDYDLIMANSILTSKMKRNQIIESLLSKLNVNGKMIMFAESGLPHTHIDQYTVFRAGQKGEEKLKFTIKLTPNKNALVFTRIN